MSTLTAPQKIKIKAAANEWISRNLPIERKLIVHSIPKYDEVSQSWNIGLTARNRNGKLITVGNLAFDSNACILDAQEPQNISARISQLLEGIQEPLAIFQETVLEGEHYKFRLGDGIECSKLLIDGGMDLLLTDPPYGISNSYTCENQVPRRLRKNGADFIMPKGNFGDWDNGIEPKEWTDVVLPKVRGWAVIFCAQAQIGEYSDILRVPQI